MKMKTNTKYYFLTCAVVSLVLLLCNWTNAQQKITSASKNSLSENTELSENTPDQANGFWLLSSTENNVFNAEKEMVWKSDNDALVALRKWVDYLTVEHTVNCGFKIDSPPDKMAPGQEFILSGSFINYEYSTTNNVRVGFKVYMERNLVKNEKLHREGTEVFKIAKDLKQHNTEAKSGVIITPKRYLGDDKTIKICVDFYVGPDHYIMNYIYNWVESSSL
jgi:hypothetical protein